MSYAKRYLTMQHFNLVMRDVDNDGQGEVQPITAAQAQQLRDELAAAGGSEARFLGWLKVASFEDIPADRFDVALRSIEDKRRQAKTTP